MTQEAVDVEEKPATQPVLQEQPTVCPTEKEETAVKPPEPSTQEPPETNVDFKAILTQLSAGDEARAHENPLDIELKISTQIQKT